MKVILIALLGISLLLGSCGEQAENATPATGDGEPRQKTDDNQNENTIPYKVLTDYDESIQENIEAIKEQRGYSILEKGKEETLVYIGSGTRKSGGYSLDVDAVTKNDGEITIFVVETSPDPDSMVTQALTYPYVVIKLTDTFEELVVVDRTGKQFEEISMLKE